MQTQFGLIRQTAQPIIAVNISGPMRSVEHHRSVPTGRHGMGIAATGGQKRGKIPARTRQIHGTSCLILVFEARFRLFWTHQIRRMNVWLLVTRKRSFRSGMNRMYKPKVGLVALEYISGNGKYSNRYDSVHTGLARGLMGTSGISFISP